MKQSQGSVFAVEPPRVHKITISLAQINEMDLREAMREHGVVEGDDVRFYVNNSLDAINKMDEPNFAWVKERWFILKYAAILKAANIKASGRTLRFMFTDSSDFVINEWEKDLINNYNNIYKVKHVGKLQLKYFVLNQFKIALSSSYEEILFQNVYVDKFKFTSKAWGSQIETFKIQNSQFRDIVIEWNWNIKTLEIYASRVQNKFVWTWVDKVTVSK